jgi:hypothetical protein
MDTPAQCAKRINVSVKTIQQWDGLGICPPNEPLPTDDATRMMIWQQLYPWNGCLKFDAQRAYRRISSQARQPDRENQKRILE